MWVEHSDICDFEFHCGLLFHFDPFWLTNYSLNFVSKFFDPPQERVFGWEFFEAPQERVFWWEFFDPPQERVFVPMLFVWVLFLW